jgi:hypothetical protein
MVKVTYDKVSYEHGFFKKRERRNLMMIGKGTTMVAVSMFQVLYFFNTSHTTQISAQ